MAAAATAVVAIGASVAEAEAELTPCEYVDVETQQGLSSRLLHTLAVRSTLRKTSVEEAVASLRSKLLPPAPPSKKAKSPPSLVTLNAALETAEDVRAKGLSFFTSKEENLKRVAAAEKEMDLSFRHPDREKLAAELIRAYDTEGEFHCGACIPRIAPSFGTPKVCVPIGSKAADAGAAGAAEAEAAADDGRAIVAGSPRSVAAMERHKLACVFRPLACRNEGCLSIHSAKAEVRHDGVCGFKPIECTLGCPAVVQRQLMGEHVEGPCPNRPVQCPFAMIGCEHACTQGTLAAHLTDACAAHLGLSLAVSPRAPPSSLTDRILIAC